MGFNSILEIGSSGLFAFRMGVQVASNNIANVETPGYTRKRIVTAERIPPEQVRAGFLGRGVDVAAIQSYRDDNLEKAVSAKSSDLSDYDTRLPLLSQIERLFNTDEDFGLGAALNRFWNAWSDLAATPQGEAQRSNLVSETETMCAYFNDIAQDMDNLTNYIGQQMKAGITEINTHIDSIVELNGRINQMEITGQEAGTERDQRSAEIKELSELIGNSYFEENNGAVSIILSNGKPLVAGFQGYHLELSGDSIIWPGDGSDVTSDVSGGQLGGWLEVMEATIPEFQANFDELAKGIIREVNRIHSTGVGLEAMSSTTGTTRVTDFDTAISDLAAGDNFFGDVTTGTFKVVTYDSSGQAVSHPITVDPSVMTVGELVAELNAVDGISASTTTDGELAITADSGYSFAFSDVNSDILMAMGVNTFLSGFDADTISANDHVADSHNQICAGIVDGKTGLIDPGDNSVALDVADLSVTKIDQTWYTYTRDGSSSQTVTQTLNEQMGSIISRIGVLASDTETDRDFHEMLLNQYQDLLGEVSGVNLDEELIDILKYQRAYQSAARVITAADELLQTLIQL